MKSIDRITVYSSLSFICFCALLFRTGDSPSLLPVVGLLAAVFGIVLEVHFWKGLSEDITE